MVDLVGIEPTTSSMPWKRAPSCATGPLWGGAALNSKAPQLILSQRDTLVKPATNHSGETPGESTGLGPVRRADLRRVAPASVASTARIGNKSRRCGFYTNE